MTAIDKIERPVATGPFEEGTTGSPLEAPIVAALREVYDPEIPVNIFDLGLIYVIDISDDGDVFIREHPHFAVKTGCRTVVDL